MMKTETILFDLDGVLVDACDWHYMALNKALEIKGYKPISKQDHETTYNGLPTSVKLKMLGISGDDSKVINELKQKITLESIEENAHEMQDKIKLHEWLKSNSFKIACVTNSIRKTTELMLKKTGQYGYFDVIICNEDVKKNKPYPDCYNLAIRKLNANPLKSVCVEDSDKGIHSAVASIVKHLIIVKDPSEVNLVNVKEKLQDIENENTHTYGW